MRISTALFLGLLIHSELIAQVIVRQPPELAPGDEYRIIFLSSEVTDARSSDIEDYNQFVQSLADASSEIGSWGLEWKALASTDTVDARDNTGTNPESDSSGVPIYGVHGAILAPSNEIL